MIGSINRRLVATFTSRDAKRGPFPPALSASSLQSCMAVDDHKKHDDAPKMRPQGLYPSFKGIRKRRTLIAVAAIWLLYLFFNNLPAGLTPAVEREDTRYGRLKPDATSREPPDSDQTDDTVAKDATTYDGPLKFYELGASLKASRHLHDSKDNVLFAFASSASTVVAAACTMAYQNRTKVHIASMGREDIKMANVFEAQLDTGERVSCHMAPCAARLREAVKQEEDGSRCKKRYCTHTPRNTNASDFLRRS